VKSGFKLVEIKYHLLFLVVTVIFATVARISLLVISPLLVLLLVIGLKLSFRLSLFVLLGFLLFCYLLSFFNGFYINYNLLSFYFVLPFLVLAFTRPQFGYTGLNLLRLFFSYLSFFAVINNFVGLIQYVKFPNDDSFSGIYGHFTVTQNGLMIINSILFFYYIRLFQVEKAKKYLLFSFFFLLALILGFYGGGLIVLFLSFLLFMVRFSFVKVIKTFLTASLIFGLLYFFTGLISPSTLQYNKNIINRFIGGKDQLMPRKLISYSNYFNGYTADLKDFLLGSGPGTFNSRSAFVIGSPEYFTSMSAFKSDKKPYYFENYAYSLWNAGNTGKYQDGFMNQPFSSMLAFLGEFGLLFSLLFVYYYYRQYKTVMSYPCYDKDDDLARGVYKFVSIYLSLLLIIDNYIDYPEISILLLLILKLSEKELIKSSGLKNNIDA
jgi:hypothetical protein